MATLENLNFKVILDDAEFNKKIQENIKAAEKFNLSVSSYLDLKKKVGSYEQRMKALAVKQNTAEAKSQEAITREKQKTAAQQEKLNQLQGKYNKGLLEQSALLRQLSLLAGSYFSVQGARQFFSELVKITGEIEVQRTALASMLGDKDKADAIFGQLRQKALESPYTLQDLNKYAKQLMAFNINPDQLVETERRIADVAAGLGVDMGRIVLAYGQVKSAGVLKGTELRQFTEAGVPVLQELADIIEETEGKAISLAEVFKRISKKEIPFEMVEQAFKRMTDEGGKFYRMQEVLVETLQGKVSKLRDVWQQSLYDFGSGEKMNELLKGGVDAVTSLVANFDNLGRIIMELVGAYGAYKAALVVVEACAARLTVTETMASVAAGSLNKVLKVLNKTLLVNPYAAIAAGVAALSFAIYKAVTAETTLERQMKNVNSTLAEFEAKTSEEVSTLDYLWRNLERAEKGTKDYDRAKKQVLSNYDKYLSETDREAIKIGELAGVYDRLKESITDANRARAEEEGLREIGNTYTETFNTIAAAFKRNLKERPVEAGIAKELSDFVFGRNGVTEATLSEGARKYKEAINAAINAAAFTGGGMFGNGIQVTLSDIDALRMRLEKAGEAANEARTALADGLNLIYGPTGTTAASGSGGGSTTSEADNDRAQQKAEAAIKARIALLQKYKAAYDKLAENPLVGENTAKELMGLFYGISDTNFDEQINAQAEALLRLNPELLEYVETIKASFGKDAADEYLKSLSALDKINEKIEDYLSKGYGETGSGVSFKISKALQDLANEEIKIDLNVADMEKELDKAKPAILANYKIRNKELMGQVDASYQEYLANAYWNEYRKRRVAEIKAQAKSQKDAAKRGADNTIKNLAKEIFTDATAGLDLSDWSHKSIAQILEIKKALSTLELPDEVREALAENTDLAEQLLKELKAIAGEKIDQTVNPELVKKWGEDAQKVAGYLDRAADSMRELAKATNDKGLANFSDAVSSFSQNLSAAGQGAAAGGWIGAIVGGATDMIFQTVTAFTQLKAEEAEAADNARDFADALRLIADTARDEAYTSIFGESTFAKIKENIRAASDSLRDYADEIAYLNYKYNNLNSVQRKSTLSAGAAIFSGLLPGLLFEKDSSEYKAFLDARQKGYEGLQMMLIRTKEASGWAKFWGAQDQYTALGELAPELWKDGEFDTEAARSFLLTNTQITEEQRKQIQNVIDLADGYKAAMEEIDAIAADLFGGVADEMAETFIDNFLQMGNAVDNLGDTFTNLGATIAKSLLKSFILDEILNEYEDEARGLITDIGSGAISGEEVAERTRQLTDAISEGVAQYGDFINALLSSFQESGLLPGASDSGTLANGIKGITEETAGVIASYINAIRADVAGLRILAESGWNEVSLIRAAVPTLNDYLQQIAAHSFNIEQTNATIARDTQKILAEFQGVISARSGRKAVEVFME